MAESERLKMLERVRPHRSALDRFALFVKAVQGMGKLRRYVIAKTRRGYIARSKELRMGECLRCGACCSIMFRCPHLKDGNHCANYDKRYEQCGHFPIDARDLRYLEHVCGYYFVRKGK